MQAIGFDKGSMPVAIRDAPSLDRGVLDFIEYEYALASNAPFLEEIKLNAVKVLDERMQEELFENCEIKEDKLNKLERMKAFMSLDKTEREDVMAACWVLNRSLRN